MAKKDESRNKLPSMQFRLDTEIKDEIVKASMKEGESYSYIIRRCLKFALLENDIFNLNNINNAK